MRGAVGGHASVDQHVLNLREIAVDDGVDALANRFHRVGCEFNADFQQFPKALNKAHGGCTSAFGNGGTFVPQFSNTAFYFVFQVLCVVFAPAGQQNAGHFHKGFAAFVFGATCWMALQPGFAGPVNAVGVQQVFLRVTGCRQFDNLQVAGEYSDALPFGAPHKKTVFVEIAFYQAKVGQYGAVNGFAGAGARKAVQQQFVQLGVVDGFPVQGQPGRQFSAFVEKGPVVATEPKTQTRLDRLTQYGNLCEIHE